MKKSTIFLSLMLTILFGITMFATNMLKTHEVAYAKQTGTFNKTAIIIGVGEVEVKPDSFQVNFGLKTKDSSLLDGQNKITKMYENVLNQIQKIDENAYVFVNYSSSYPVSEGGLLSYDFDYNVVVKSNEIDKKDDLIEGIINAGATSINNTTYTLNNKDEVYSQALLKAKENADKKINAISKSATLLGLKEESFYNFYESFRSEKIKVCAKIKAYYQLENAQTNLNLNTQVSQNFKEENVTQNKNYLTKDIKEKDENRQVVVENFLLKNKQNLNEEKSKNKEDFAEQNITENTSKLTDNAKENLSENENKKEEIISKKLSQNEQENLPKTLEEIDNKNN